MKAIHDIWKKPDLNFISNIVKLSEEERLEASQDLNAQALINSFTLNFFFEHLLTKHQDLLASHSEMAKELSSLGIVNSPNNLPATSIESWIPAKAKFVNTFEKTFRNRYGVDLLKSKDRLRRAANKISENLGLLENLIQQENSSFENLSVTERKTDFEIDEKFINIERTI